LNTGPGHVLSSGTAESATDLAVTRTILAAQRTLMAWIRTALSMISFGFTIYKFLHGMHEAGGIRLRRPEEPRHLGLFLVVLGTGSLVVAVLEYLRTLGRTEGHRPRPGSAFYVACAVIVLGIWVLVGLFSKRGPA
jgi:putative membrane protein